MKIIIETQLKENYGAHAWDGEGQCPQAWKFKGGNTFVIEGIEFDEDLSQVESIVAEVTPLLTSKSDYYEEYVLGHEVLEDDRPTSFMEENLPNIMWREMSHSLNPRLVKREGVWSRVQIRLYRELEVIDLQTNETTHASRRLQFAPDTRA